MKIISHRGNLRGISKYENHPSTILNALEQKFSVEIDLWQVKNFFYFGHDKPQYKVNIEEWDKKSIYFHLKSPCSYRFKNADSFFIHSDRWAYTRKGFIWCNFNELAGEKSILTSPELVHSKMNRLKYFSKNSLAFGICTDFPFEYLNIIQEFKINKDQKRESK